MAIFPNVYVTMVMISSMGIIYMSISYCPYALLGQYHEMKEVLKHCFQSKHSLFCFICNVNLLLNSLDRAQLLQHSFTSYLEMIVMIYFFSFLQYVQHSPGNSRRGLGIDCAILSCQVGVYGYSVNSDLRLLLSRK